MTEQTVSQRVRKGALGSMMAGGLPVDGRQKDDFYATPADVTRALLTVEDFPGRVWEPCAGDGAIRDVLLETGYEDVVCSDINPRVPGIVKRNMFDVKKPVALSIITNPPFQIDGDRDAADIIEHLLSLRPRKLALMLKSSFWHAKSRTPLFERHLPAWVYPLNWRPDFLGLGRPTMEVSWVVWHQHNTEYPRFRVLKKPLPAPAETQATPAKELAI